MSTTAEPGPEVVLHIGTMKSGTSYLQAVLRRNRQELGDEGCLVAREVTPAVIDVLGRRNVIGKAKVRDAWDRFLATVEAWGGDRVVASQEFLSGASADEAKAVVSSLPHGKVKIVITNRDLVRVVPSHWQTVVKNGATVSFPDYVQLLLEPPAVDGSRHRYAVGFWRHHDIGEIVQNWAAAAGADNVVLVTVPPSGAPGDLLWHRFAEALGLRGSGYDLTPTVKSNISLTFTTTEMLRQVNIRVRRNLGGGDYRLLVNKYLANKLLRQSPEDEPSAEARRDDRPRLGAESHRRFAAKALETIDVVASSGVQVIGDLDDLRISAYAGTAREDTARPEHPIPESVSIAIARLVVRLSKVESRARRRQGGAKGGRGAEREDYDHADAEDDLDLVRS